MSQDEARKALMEALSDIDYESIEKSLMDGAPFDHTPPPVMFPAMSTHPHAIGPRPQNIPIRKTYSLPPPPYEKGDRVQWRRDGKLHAATVSRYEQGVIVMDSCVGDPSSKQSTSSSKVHIRLDRPIETPGGRRWAWDAALDDVEPLNAIVMLGDLE